jgi:uncharacterized membrane protein (DUF2068 family)
MSCPVEINMAKKRTPALQSRQQHDGKGLRIIAVLKLANAILLLAVGIGAIKLLHKDVAEMALNLIAVMRVDPDNRLVHGLIAKLGLVDDRKLEELSIGSFFYAAIHLTEGIGLWMKKRWAEYLAIVITCSLVPLELYEIAKRVSIIRVAFLVVNLAIVWYLFTQVRKGRK